MAYTAYNESYPDGTRTGPQVVSDIKANLLAMRDAIVMGGGLSGMPHLYERVPRLWSRWVFSGDLPDPVRTRLVPARHGDASGVRGAAWLWRDG